MAENYTPRVVKVLKSYGCEFVRHGKGDHDIWWSPVNDKKFMVDSHIKGRLWANRTLKNAGVSRDHFL